MPKKGIVKCESCDEEFEGMFPDDKKVGYSYISAFGDPLDPNLIKELQKHHLDTATIETPIGKILGHKYYLVFLEDGSIGKLEANSYSLIYKELGKERY